MTIKIFTCYHKSDHLLKSDIIVPLQVGKAIAKTDLGISGDDSNDNISDKNPYFCELTATYWIWKNVSADYVGLFHYRRFLNFLTEDTKSNILTDNFLDKYGITDSNIMALLEQYDVILPKKTDKISLTLYDFYKKVHVIEDIDCMLSVIQEKYPTIYPLSESILKNQSQGYFANMIITSKSFFDEYASWIFDILFTVEDRIQSQLLNREPYQQRVYGFLSERLMTIFIAYKQQTQGIRIKELPSLFIESDPNQWKKYQRRRMKRKILRRLGFNYVGNLIRRLIN